MAYRKRRGYPSKRGRKMPSRMKSRKHARTPGGSGKVGYRL